MTAQDVLVSEGDAAERGARRKGEQNVARRGRVALAGAVGQDGDRIPDPGVARALDRVTVEIEAPLAACIRRGARVAGDEEGEVLRLTAERSGIELSAPTRMTRLPLGSTSIPTTLELSPAALPSKSSRQLHWVVISPVETRSQTRMSSLATGMPPTVPLEAIDTARLGSWAPVHRLTLN